MAWPLCFTYAGSVIGNGFLAHVDLCGRLLAVPEADGVWLYGVNPAAVAVGAPTLSDANFWQFHKSSSLSPASRC